jgi:predicted Zn-dependent peptidase
MRLSAGAYIASAGVQTDKTADALREIFNELNGIRKPVTADELERAKSYIALSFPGEFETTGNLSAQMEELVVYKLPDDYFAHYVEKIEAVTVADVERAAMTYIQPSRLLVVVVGDRKAIEAGIRMLNLAPVQVMTVEQALGQ